MNKETTLQNKIRCALSDYGICFRTNAGKFWQGKMVYSNEYKQNILINIRPVVGLPEGFSDTLFVGNNKVAFVEIKTPTGTVKDKQSNFLKTMRKYGHTADVVRSVEQAIELVKE